MRAHAVLLLLLLLASTNGCQPPAPAVPQPGHHRPSLDYGRPTILGRTEGEQRVWQGRRPIWIKVDPQTVGSQSFSVAMEELPPGDSIGVHKHLQEDEVVYVARGHLQVRLADSTHSAEAGSLVFIPRGTWIGFHVAGPDTATIVFMFNTPGFERCLRFLSAPVGTAFVRPSPEAIAAARVDCHQLREVDSAH